LQDKYVDSNISQGISSNVPDIASNIAPEIVIPFRRLLAVGETKRGGLILCKSHYAEFAGPGAAIACPTAPGYSSIIAIGDPELLEVINPSDRQRAYSRRIQWVRWLQKIVFHPDPVQRAEKLFLGFEEFFSGEVVSQISDEALALLAAVLPQTISAVRSQNRHFGLGDSSRHGNGKAVPIVILNGTTLQPIKCPSAQHQRLNSLQPFLDECATLANSVSSLNPPLLGDFDSNSSQNWGTRRAKTAVGIALEISPLPQSA